MAYIYKRSDLDLQSEEYITTFSCEEQAGAVKGSGRPRLVCRLKNWDKAVKPTNKEAQNSLHGPAVLQRAVVVYNLCLLRSSFAAIDAT